VFVSPSCAGDAAIAALPPVARATPGFSSFACRLPSQGPIDRDIRVAVFDGGVKPDAGLDAWVGVSSR
jgi:hypothetical protein